MRDRRDLSGLISVAVVLLFGVGLWAGGFTAMPSAHAQSEESDDEASAADPDPGASEDSGGESANASDGEAASGESEETASSESSDEKEGAGESGQGKGDASEKASEKQPFPVPEDSDEDFQRELEQFRKAYDRYTTEVDDYRETVDSIVDAAYQKRKSKITDRYDEQLGQLKKVERRRRGDAIERFKTFLKRHPDREQYTPDAMYRLAELYFEQANDEYLQADQKYRKEMERYRKGRRPDAPDSPSKDYSNVIETFSTLIHDWPDYRLLDGAYYLLAYCHEQMGNSRKARDLFAELIVERPESEFVPEAWLRIGEFHFAKSEQTEEIELARYAYRQSMKYEKSVYFDKALYKLAWANFRLDNYARAIRNFERLVEWRDDSGEKSGSVLRKEAIKYVAISLAQEDWDVDRSVDDAFVMPRVKKYLGEGKPYERKILDRLVGYLFDNSRYKRAGRVIRYTLDRYPKHPDNPKLHKRLIRALLKKPRDLEGAFEERGKLIELYGPDSDWYAHQKKQGNEEAVEYGRKLIQDNLIKAATWYHERAQKLKKQANRERDQELLEESRDWYGRAAKAYRRFLKRYPNNDDIYKWNFFYADALYYSGNYKKAYEQYRVVRELDVADNKFQADAAFNAVKALEFRIKELAEKGEVPKSAVPGGGKEEAREVSDKAKKNANGSGNGKGGSNGNNGRANQKEPEDGKKEIPEMLKRYVTAMDRYVVLRLEYREDVAPKFAFNAAKVYYDHAHYDKARERFEWIVDTFPKREEARLAGRLILEMFKREEKYDKMEQWAEANSKLFDEETEEEIKKLQRNASFKEANKAFKNEEYEKAAKLFEKLVERYPDYENNPRALNNAAVAYEKLKKYNSALETYKKVYQRYPENPLAGYALYRVAVNAERFFDFEQASETYMKFYAKYSDRSSLREVEGLGFNFRRDETYMTFFQETPSETTEELRNMGFEVEGKLPGALLSAGVLSQNLQEYELAAKLFEMYVRRYTNEDKAPRVQWQAVEAWSKAGKKREMFDAIDRFSQEFGSSSDQAGRVLEGMMRRADYYKEQGRDDRAFDKYEEIIETFKERDLEKSSVAAYYAAEARFRLADREFEEWKKIKLEGDLKRQIELLKKKAKESSKVRDEYKKIWENYSVPQYTLAGFFRIGAMYENFAETIYDAPCNFERGSKKFMMCRQKLNQRGKKYEKKAISIWEKAYGKAKELDIFNEWTERTLKKLNTYKPKKYSLGKASRTARQDEPITGLPMMSKPSDDEESDETGDSGASDE